MAHRWGCTPLISDSWLPTCHLSIVLTRFPSLRLWSVLKARQDFDNLSAVWPQCGVCHEAASQQLFHLAWTLLWDPAAPHSITGAIRVFEGVVTGSKACRSKTNRDLEVWRCCTKALKIHDLISLNARPESGIKFLMQRARRAARNMILACRDTSRRQAGLRLLPKDPLDLTKHAPSRLLPRNQLPHDDPKGVHVNFVGAGGPYQDLQADLSRHQHHCLVHMAYSLRSVCGGCWFLTRAPACNPP